MLIGNLEMVLLACIAGLKKIRVSDYPFGFGYPRISILDLNLYRNWSSGFGFGCPDTPPEPNLPSLSLSKKKKKEKKTPTCTHPHFDRCHQLTIRFAITKS